MRAGETGTFLALNPVVGGSGSLGTVGCISGNSFCYTPQTVSLGFQGVDSLILAKQAGGYELVDIQINPGVWPLDLVVQATRQRAITFTIPYNQTLQRRKNWYFRIIKQPLYGVLNSTGIILPGDTIQYVSYEYGGPVDRFTYALMTCDSSENETANVMVADNKGLLVKVPPKSVATSIKTLSDVITVLEYDDKRYDVEVSTTSGYFGTILSTLDTESDTLRTMRMFNATRETILAFLAQTELLGITSEDIFGEFDGIQFTMGNITKITYFTSNRRRLESVNPVTDPTSVNSILSYTIGLLLVLWLISLCLTWGKKKLKRRKKA